MNSLSDGVPENVSDFSVMRFSFYNRSQAETILEAEAKRIAAETRLRAQQEQISENSAKQKNGSLNRDEALAAARARKQQLEREFELERAEIQRLLVRIPRTGKGT